MTTRRNFIQTTAAAGAAMAFPQANAADDDVLRLGLLTVKTGPLASGGIDMERALTMYLSERNNMMAGKKVQLFVADTGGVPATAKSKIQELYERVLNLFTMHKQCKFIFLIYTFLNSEISNS
jgi:branched-chain amino acid transport system substrate-binding protein